MRSVVRISACVSYYQEAGGLWETLPAAAQSEITQIASEQFGEGLVLELIEVQPF